MIALFLMKSLENNAFEEGVTLNFTNVQF